MTINESSELEPATSADEEHFKPVGTMFILAMFVAALILLWASVYVILISRGVTV
ncbi:MAG: cytochrome c oxidase subunit 2A [Acidimicrobiales bacterium]